MSVGNRGKAALLYLARAEDRPESGERSVVEISDAVGVETDSMADRVGLLSSLRTLEAEGLVESATASVGRGDGERTVFGLTEAGERHVADLEADLQGRQVQVAHEEGSETVQLGDADRYFDEKPLIRALSKLTDDGVIYLEPADATDFVNRERTLERFDTAIERVEDGATDSLVLAGEAGIGKTTLLDELADRVGQQGWSVLRGDGHTGGIEPYEPLLSAFRSAGLDTDWLDADAVPSFEASEGDDARVRVNAEREAIRTAFLDRLADRTDETPIAILVDDLQWVDRATMWLLRSLLESDRELPVLLVAAGRPAGVDEHHHAWGFLHGATESVERLHLDPLDRTDTRRLLQSRIGRTDLPTAFVDAVYEHTGGTPLFVEESIATMREDGTLDPTHGVYPDEETIPVPDAVETTVEHRLAALDPEPAAVLSTASVLGDRVDRTVLAATVDLDGATVDDYLDLLADSGLLRRTDEGLRFDCGLVRETIYDRLEPGERADRHQAVAEALEGMDGPSIRVATHYEAAGADEAALERYLDAAEAAMDVHALEDAIDYYEQAVRLAEQIGDDAAKVEALEAIGRTHFVLGQFDDAQKHFEFVRAETDDTALEQGMLVWTAAVEYVRGNLDVADALVDEGLAMAPAEYRPALLYRRGWIAYRRGDLDDAEAAFEAQLEAATEAVDRGRAHHGLGTVAVDRDELATARSRFERSLEQFPETSAERASTCNNLAIACRRLGDLEAALSWCSTGQTMAEKVGHKRIQIALALNGANIKSQLGRNQEALSSVVEARALAESIGDRQGVAHATVNEGKFRLDAGDIDAAIETLETTRDHWQAVGDDRSYGQLLTLLATGESRRGNLDRAAEHCREGIDVLDGVGPQLTVPLRAEFARIELRRRNLEAAVEHAEQASEGAAGVQAAEPEIAARVALGAVRREQGRYDEAREQLETAHRSSADNGDARRTAEAGYELGVLALETGDHDNARQRFETVQSNAREHGFDDLRKRCAEQLDMLAE